jgi:hypothetical protein
MARAAAITRRDASTARRAGSIADSQTEDQFVAAVFGMCEPDGSKPLRA